MTSLAAVLLMLVLRVLTLQTHELRLEAQPAARDRDGGGGGMQIVLYNPLTAASVNRVQQISVEFQRIDIVVDWLARRKEHTRTTRYSKRLNTTW